MSLTTVITRRNSWKESLGKIWGGEGGGAVNKVHYGISENDELPEDMNMICNVQIVTVSQNYQLSIACEERIRSFTNLPIS